MVYQGKEVHRGNIVTVHVPSEQIGVQGFVSKVSKTMCDVETVVGNKTVTYRCTLSGDGSTLIGIPVETE
ncbi:hypothetical protein GCM10025859_66960 [Alicyclobacillus fastidiosus]|nr:hypothetical protein GCM10025859_66630 [Alicyclobacillus fastidiosus]GMA66254.1 hypothetical protein GCM10025859_66960 [Alicyclobacillus fastidiosus]